MSKKDEAKPELVEVSVANPPAAPAPVAPKTKAKDETRENAMGLKSLGGFLTPIKSVNAKSAVGAAGGLFATLAVPRLIGWADGCWKELAAIGGTTIVGGGIGGRIAEEAYGGLNGLGSDEVFGGIGQDEELFVGQSPLEPTYTGAM